MPRSRLTLPSLSLCILTALTGLASAQDRPTRDLVDTAVAAGQFRTLARAAEAAGLLDALRGRDPLTVFAPTDEAFAALGEEKIRSLLEPANREQLLAILKLHVVPGRVDARAAVTAGTATSLAGSDLTIRLEDGRLKVGDANVIRNDVAASNGVIHVIDQVLLPPAAEAVPQTPRLAARALIEAAVERGAPRFNAGDAKACAEFYDLALLALIGLGGDVLDERQREALVRARAEATGETDARDAAWRLRRALDATYRSLASDSPTRTEPASQPRTLRPRR